MESINNKQTKQNTPTNNISTPIISTIPETRIKRKYTKSADKPDKYYISQQKKLNELRVKPIIKPHRNSKLEESDKQYAIKTMVEATNLGISKTNLAKRLRISMPMLYKLYRENYELYSKLLKEKQNLIQNRALFKAELGLSTIKKSGFKQLNTLQTTQAVKNLFDVATYSDKHNDISINIGIPEHRNEIISYILEGTRAEPISAEIPKESI